MEIGEIGLHIKVQLSASSFVTEVSSPSGQLLTTSLSSVVGKYCEKRAAKFVTSGSGLSPATEDLRATEIPHASGRTDVVSSIFQTDPSS